MEGVVVISNLDVYAQAGANRALIKTITVNVTDGALNIQFIHQVENPAIKATEVVRAP